MDILDAVPFLAQTIRLSKEVRGLLSKDNLVLAARIEPHVFGPDYTRVYVEVTNYSEKDIHIREMGLLVGEEEFPFLSPSYGTGMPSLIPEYLEAQNSFDVDRLFADASILQAVRKNTELRVYLIDGVRRFAWGEVDVDPFLTRS